MSRPTSMIGLMRKQFAKQSLDLICALSRSGMLSNKPCCQCIEPDRVFVKARAAQANQIRGLLSEFGIVIPQGIQSISKRIPGILEDAENGLPEIMRRLLERLNDHLRELDRQVNELEWQIKLWHKESEASLED